jgi:hypothetical protein
MPEIRKTWDSGLDSDCGGCGMARGCVSSDVQRCWCRRLCRIWAVVALWGVGGVLEEEMRVVRADGGGGEVRGVEGVILGVERWNLPG